MVLSWRADYQGKTYRIFGGSGDVRIFLFYFENVVSREVEDGKKSYELLSNLNVNAFEFLLSRFTKDRELKTEALGFKIVKKSLLEKFMKKE